MKYLDLPTALNEAPIVFFVFDSEGIFEISLGKTLALVGLKPGEAVGKSFRDLYADFPEVLATCEAALSGDQIVSNVAVGDIIFETIYQPISGSDGKITHVIGLSTDATAKVRATKEIEDLNQAMIGRELKMIELKKEIAALKNQ